MKHTMHENQLQNQFSEVVKRCVLQKMSSMALIYRQRLNAEMALFNQEGYAEALYAYRVVCALREAGYSVGAGRNTMAGSLVHYLLGLTAIDPVAHGLSFERFYSPVLRGVGRLVYEFDIDKPAEEAEALLRAKGFPLNDALKFYRLEALTQLHRVRLQGVQPSQFPTEDAETLALFARGETADIFRFEGEAMRGYLKRFKPESMGDLCLLDALFRPHTLHLIEPLIEAKQRGYQRTGDAAYDSLVAPTYGMLVYQEQFLALFSSMFGITATEAERLRVQILRNEPLDYRYASRLTDTLRAACKTAFPKAHSVAYTQTAYCLAYLKTHYPQQWESVVII